MIVVADPAALAKTAADRLDRKDRRQRRRVAICLTGGSSPKQLYRLLATDAYRSRIPWDRVHWFIGDERFVAAGRSAATTWAMARRIFLDRLAPPANIHPIRPTAPIPMRAARRYESELQSFYGADRAGSGPAAVRCRAAGRRARRPYRLAVSGYPAIEETRRWVVGVPKAHVEPFVPRVTLTLPALDSCREMLFEAAGAEKRAILTRVLGGENLPANRAHSTGETIWLVDKAALPENFRG